MEDLEGLEETLSILSNSAGMRRLRKAEAELAEGQDEELAKEQAMVLVRPT